MAVCVYPGTFDPITCGHLDIIQRAAPLFEKMIILVGKNSAKSPFFTVEERVDFAQRVTAHLPNTEVDTFDGLLVHYVQRIQAHVIVRGLRALSDYDYEYQMASTNHTLCPNIETIFLMTALQYAFLSSSIVREIGRNGESLSGMVPEPILYDVTTRLAQNKSQNR